MAKMGGCDYQHASTKSPQGKGRVTPSSFARNNMSMGGVNDHLGGSDTKGKSPALKSGQTGQGKHRHDKR